MEECTINIYLFAEFAFESLYCADPTTADMWLYSYDSPSAINVYMNGEPVNEYGQEPHVHNFTYEAEPGTQLGASITAICSEENCDLPDNCVSLILYPPEIETEGDVEHAYASLDAEAFNAATGLDVTESDIQYYDSNDTLLEEAPTAAGNYTVRITVQGQTASVAYTINQA